MDPNMECSLFLIDLISEDIFSIDATLRLYLYSIESNMVFIFSKRN